MAVLISSKIPILPRLLIFLEKNLGILAGKFNPQRLFGLKPYGCFQKIKTLQVLRGFTFQAIT
ncbi:hypothetical protein BUE76_14810 [Cnuella takakiae]|nr:hypothetical protein BUE76_14810 [Cnuella takakiae]